MRFSAFFLLILLLFPVASGAETAPQQQRIVSNNNMTHYRNSGPVTYAPETYAGLDLVRRGHTDQAYAVWVQQGFQGDIEALALAAMLCRVEESQPTPDWKIHLGGETKKTPPPVCPVPARFWEESMIALLGEGEGTLLLGLFGIELVDSDPFKRGTVYAPIVEAYMLRSALAGNPAGMYGAYLTGEHRNGKQFTPPRMLQTFPFYRKNLNKTLLLKADIGEPAPPMPATSGPCNPWRGSTKASRRRLPRI